MLTRIKKIKDFTRKLIAEIKKDDIMSAANDLTYSIFFSAFPFALFLISVAGLLRIDERLLAENILYVMPDIIKGNAEIFIQDMTARSHANIISVSLLAAVWSASAGFRTATRSINKAYGIRDARKFYFRVLISIALVFIFSFIIILCLALLIFGANIMRFFPRESYAPLFHMARYIISVIVLFFSVILINKIALFKNKRTGLRSLSRGALFTCAAWVAVSALFNIYIDNFTNFPAIYGSVGAVIALMLWINIICVTLLIGSEINAVLDAS